MSDNVSQLQPQKKPGLGKRIAAFVLLAVLVAGGVAAYVFRCLLYTSDAADE